MHKHSRSTKVLLVVMLFFSLTGPLLSSASTAFAAPTPKGVKTYCLFACADVNFDDLAAAIHDLIGLIDRVFTEYSDKLTAQVKEILTEAKNSLNELINNVDEAVQRNTKIIAAQINQLMRQFFVQAQDLIRQGYETVRLLIESAGNVAIEVIDRFANQARSIITQFKEAAKEIIIVAVGGAVVVIDRTAYQLYGLVSFGLLLVVLIFVMQNLWALWTRGLPELTIGRNWRSAALFGSISVLLFLLILPGLVFFAQPVRAWAVTTGSPTDTRELNQANRPVGTEIYGAAPNIIVLGETQEISVIGYNLRPEGRHSPKAQIDGVNVPVTPRSNAELTIGIGALSVSTGTKGLILTYESNVSGTDVITVDTSVVIRQKEDKEKKPDFVITDFRLSPPSPIVNQATTAYITVLNQGDADAGAFNVEWKPEASMVGPLGTHDALPVGVTVTLQLSYSYITPGNFESLAIVDPAGSVPEKAEGDRQGEANNIVKLAISVGEPATQGDKPGPVSIHVPVDIQRTIPKAKRPPAYKCQTVQQIVACDE